jgi:hypothetical protein
LAQLVGAAHGGHARHDGSQRLEVAPVQHQLRYLFGGNRSTVLPGFSLHRHCIRFDRHFRRRGAHRQLDVDPAARTRIEMYVTYGVLTEAFFGGG